MLWRTLAKWLFHVSYMEHEHVEQETTGGAVDAYHGDLELTFCTLMGNEAAMVHDNERHAGMRTRRVALCI